MNTHTEEKYDICWWHPGLYLGQAQKCRGVKPMKGVSNNVWIWTSKFYCVLDVDIPLNVFRCEGGQTLNSDVVCLLDYDERVELTGCRDLSHLSDCG